MLFYFTIDLIEPEKAGFLYELLNEVGRKDLTPIVREYMEKLDRKSLHYSHQYTLKYSNLTAFSEQFLLILKWVVLLGLMLLLHVTVQCSPQHTYGMSALQAIGTSFPLM